MPHVGPRRAAPAGARIGLAIVALAVAALGRCGDVAAQPFTVSDGRMDRFEVDLAGASHAYGPVPETRISR